MTNAIYSFADIEYMVSTRYDYSVWLKHFQNIVTGMERYSSNDKKTKKSIDYYLSMITILKTYFKEDKKCCIIQYDINRNCPFRVVLC